ncbi:MAG: DUF2125 domain-containing protein [Alphaproteobacteria bacterium]|nr:DUF2125 domain-containing protein [Alphaproteobacteria bacterium]
MMSRPRPLVIFFVVLALLAGAYSGWWMVLASGLRDGVAAWAGERRALGHEVTHGDLDVAGFPLSLRLRLGEASYVLNPQGVGWAWRGGGLGVTVSPWDPGHFEFSIHGVHRLTYASGDGGWRTATLSMGEGGEAGGMVGLDGAGLPWAGFLDAEGLEVKLREDGATVALRRFHFDLRKHPPGEMVDGEAAGGDGEAGLIPAHEAAFLQVAFILEGLRLPEETTQPFGPEVDLVQGRIDLLGAPPRGPARAAAQAWRDNGGTVELGGFALRWDGLDVSGEGTLALDGELQPTGAMTLSVQGFGTVIDTLVAKGVIQPGPAATARTILGLMAKTPEDGGAPVLKAPLSVQKRKLFVGPVRLMELPALVWE